MSHPTDMPAPAVSVVIPVHNCERYVAEAVRSVLRQTRTDFELIVVDDGSTDGTAEIVSSFADPRIRLIRTPRGGISSAINAGISASRADLIARLDGDDAMEPERLQRQVDFLEARPWLGGGASYYWVMDEKGTLRGSEEPPLVTVADLELQLSHRGRLIYPHPTVMMRRHVLARVGGYDSRYDKCEDVELFMRMYEAGWPMLVQPERLTRFRVHASSTTASSVRVQYFLNEAIFANFRRRRRGDADLPVEHYMAAAHASPWRWLITEGRILSRRLQRMRTVALMADRRLAGTLALVAAAAVDPISTTGALRRKLKRIERQSLSPWRAEAPAPIASGVAGPAVTGPETTSV
ncbi:glycosyltransferase family 2 protein [Phenylobacterium sp.]|jgi:glycosyltransferase involved in cell wall biosynthesis|uniref:glycosyltransferase family 2 protein n=1 Tax=Phenylobacterium sp. TaxID=1871053 RepID=UPI002F42BC6C